jgi:hypothetical protein
MAGNLRLSLLILISLIPWASATELVDRVIASVNNSVLTQRMLDDEVDNMNRMMAMPNGPTKGRIPPLEVVRRRALDSLIDEELMLQRNKDNLRKEAAERYAERTINEQISDLRKRMGDDQFNSRLAEENQSLDEFRASLISDRVRQILIQQARQSWIDEMMLTPVSQAQIDKYIDENPTVVEQGAAPEAQFVFIRIPPGIDKNGVEVLRSKAEKVLAKARTGESFDNLVTEYSQHDHSKAQGGFLDLINRTTPFAEFAPLFDLEAGQVYPQVIQIEGWFCVAKVKNKQSQYNLVRKRMATDEMVKELKKLREEAVIVLDRELFPSTEP